MEEPNLDDNISDVDRLERYVRNNLGYNEIDFRLDILRKCQLYLERVILRLQ